MDRSYFYLLWPFIRDNSRILHQKKEKASKAVNLLRSFQNQSKQLPFTGVYGL